MDGGLRLGPTNLSDASELERTFGRIGRHALLLPGIREVARSKNRTPLPLRLTSARRGRGQPRIPRSNGPAPESAHQDQRSSLLPRSRNSGDPGRKIRAISGGSGAGRLENCLKENPAYEAACLVGAGRAPARPRKFRARWLRRRLFPAD